MTTVGFDLLGRAEAPGPWTGASSPLQVSSSWGVLASAWRNPALRLSGRASSRWQTRRPTMQADLPSAIADWRDLLALLPDMCLVGFTPPKSNRSLVLVRPARWLPAQFDPLRQVLVRGLVDAAGRLIPIIIPQAPHNQAAIAVVETLPDAADRSLLARLVVSAGGISLHPISLVDATGIRSLLPQAPASTPPELAAPAQDDDSQDDEDTHDEAAVSVSSSVLDQCLEACLALGNAGQASFRQWPLVTAAAREARGLGLESLGAALDRLVTAQGRDRAEALLLSAWILACQRQAIPVAACHTMVTSGLPSVL